MNKAMQLKAVIKNMAKQKHISAQIVLQNYMLERFLERISLSRYQPNFILKGGLLIAAIVGIDTRSTMDMDTTLKGMPVNAESIANMLKEVCAVRVDDGVMFSFKRLEEIREGAEYNGFRVSLEAVYPPMAVPLKIDITTGDRITPGEVSFEYRLLLESRSIRILAYNLETIIAEKLETVVARADQNTRPRDYYDIYIIHRLQWQNVDISLLKKALTATCNSRGSTEVMTRYKEIIDAVRNSDVILGFWQHYRSQFEYARTIEFEEVCHTIREVLDTVYS